MFQTILAIVAPVVLCAVIGYAWVRARQPYDADFVGRIVLSIAAPALTVSALGKVRLGTEALLAMAGWWAGFRPTCCSIQESTGSRCRRTGTTTSPSRW